jgi:hypothetical protein
VRKIAVLLCSLLLFSVEAVSQTRSFDVLFPNLSQAERARAFTPGGLVMSSRDQNPRIMPAPGAGIDIATAVVNRNLSFLTESLLVIPINREVSRLNIYNALGNIQGLRGRVYHSYRRDNYIPLFEEANRIADARRTAAIPDPPRASAVPMSETVYIRLRDVNFGNSFYRAEIRTTHHGLLYSLSNFRALTYLFVPVIREDRFVAQLYFEVLEEGVLVYSIAGTDVSDFVARQINIPSAIQKRLEVIIQWVVEGIETESRR